MNSIQMVEDILGHFPNLGSTEILLELNRVYKDFCAKSRIYTDKFNLSENSNPALQRNVVTYQLPEYIGQIYRIDMLNANNKDIPLYDRPEYLIEHNSITFLDSNGERVNEFPIDLVKIVRINYIRIPSNLDLDTNTQLAIDSKWSDGIIAGVLKKLYSKYSTQVVTDTGVITAKDWNAVKHYTQEYLRAIADAKAEANREKDITSWNVKLINFT